MAASSDGTVFALGSDGSLMALSPTGKTLWRAQTTSEHGPLAASGDEVYLQSGAELVGIVAPGIVRWQVPAEDEITSATPAPDGGVIAGAKGGAVIAISPDGSRRWSFTPAGGFAGSVALRGGAVFVGSRSGRLYALDASTGAEQWHFDSLAPVRRGPVANPAGPLFFESDALYAVAPDGNLAWSKTLPAKTAVPLASDGVGGVFGPIGDRSAAVLNSDGTFKWTTRSFGDVVESTVSPLGILYVATGEGLVYAIK